MTGPIADERLRRMSKTTSPVKRPITAEDLFRITLVSDPQAAPDGSAFAWVQTRLDKEADAYRSAIWIYQGDSAEVRPLTSGISRDMSPKWSPDGATIAFLSNRPGLFSSATSAEADEASPDDASNEKNALPKEDKPKNQLWTIRIDGGEAVQLTNHPNGVSDHDWSPAGHALAFIAQDDVEITDEFEAPVTNGGVADERIIRDIRFRSDGQGFIERFSHVWRVDLHDRSTRQLTHGDAHDGSPTWSPDGKSLAFVSNRSAERRQEWNRSSIYVLNVVAGSVKPVTPEDAAFESPQWSPSGERLAFLGHLDARIGGSKNNNVWTVGADGSDLTNHTSDWDISIGDYGMSDVHATSAGTIRWLDDSRVIALVSERGETQAYRIDLTETSSASGGASASAHERLTEGSQRISGFAIAGERLILVRGRIDAPFELFASSLDGTHQDQLTHANDALLEEVALASAQEIETSSTDGQPVQSWLLHPYGFSAHSGARHPMIVQIHGGPHAMCGHSMFHEMQLMAAKGYAVLFSNPRGSAGYGERFTSCTRGKWGESDMPDVIAAVDSAVALGWIDPERLGVTGGSYGGYLTNWIVGHDHRFKAAVTQRCVSNFHSFFGTSDIGSTFGKFEFDGVPWKDAAKLLHYSPISYVDSIETPLLIIHNESDLRCPIEQAEQMFTALKFLGKEVGFVRIPEEGHDLSRSGTPSRRLARLHHLIAWFDAHI